MMFTPRSRFTLRQLSEDVLVMKTNPARRLLFAALALLLFVAFLAGFDSASDLSGGRIGGTIFYAVLFLICVVVAVWETRFLFDADDRRFRFERRLLGFQVKGGEQVLEEGSAVVVQQVRLIRESEQPERKTIFSGRFRNYASRRNSIGKLVLETPEHTHFLDDSSNVSELEEIGRGIAEFLSVPYRKEDI